MWLNGKILSWPHDNPGDGHDPGCGWANGGAPCLQFSTDGTLLGAEIAHSMGTTSEVEITLMGRESAFFSDVEAEQAEWDE